MHHVSVYSGTLQAKIGPYLEALTSQNLAQLDTPLVEAVDVPDGALGESEVLVVDDQRTQSPGRDLLCEDRGRGSVAEEGFVWDELLGGPFGLDLVGSLADHEGFGLSEEVGGKHPDQSQCLSLTKEARASCLLLVLVVLNGIVALSGEDEVGGDEFRALMEKLVEGVLGVGRRLSEDDWARSILDVVATSCDGLAI